MRVQLCTRLKSRADKIRLCRWAEMCSESTNEFVLAAIEERIKSLSEARPDFAKIVEEEKHERHR